MQVVTFFSENQILCAKSVKIHKVTWYLVLHLNEFDRWIWDYSSLQMKKNIVRGWKEKNTSLNGSCNNYNFFKVCAFWVLWRKSNSAWMLIFFFCLPSMYFFKLLFTKKQCIKSWKIEYYTAKFFVPSTYLSVKYFQTQFSK